MLLCHCRWWGPCRTPAFSVMLPCHAPRTLTPGCALSRLPGWGHVPTCLRQSQGLRSVLGLPSDFGKSPPCWSQFPRSEPESPALLTPEDPLPSAPWIGRPGSCVHSQGPFKPSGPSVWPFLSPRTHPFCINFQPQADHKDLLETKLIYFSPVPPPWPPGHPGCGAAALPLS